MELETALLILPPKSVQLFAYPIREEYDPLSFVQTPAHITLIYPFAPPEKIEESIDTLSSICRETIPFQVTLDRYNVFKTGHVLEPSNPEPILQVYRRIAVEFPEYPPYKGEFGTELRPHLSLTRFEKPTEADTIELPPVPEFSFTIDKLHIYLGSIEDEAPFIPRAVLPLGSSK
jgi:2'-5' RNA ligase